MTQQNKTLEKFIFTKRATGCYTFTTEDAQNALNISDNNLNQTLYRNIKKRRIAVVRNGFYVILPPEYSTQEMLPVYLFIDDLMKWLNKPYYLALYSAAALHGASHQQPMESFVITQMPPLRTIRNNNLILNFSVKENWDSQDIIQKKTDAGYINISSPELTALDLMVYLKESGINRCLTVISDLAESMNPEKLKQTALRYHKTIALQRLGYLLEAELEQQELSEAIHAALVTRKHFYAPLSPHHGKTGDFISKWKIIKNVELGLDQ